MDIIKREDVTSIKLRKRRKATDIVYFPETIVIKRWWWFDAVKLAGYYYDSIEGGQIKIETPGDNYIAIDGILYETTILSIYSTKKSYDKYFASNEEAIEYTKNEFPQLNLNLRN
jgi:hypothetical protein